MKQPPMKFMMRIYHGAYFTRHAVKSKSLSFGSLFSLKLPYNSWNIKVNDIQESFGHFGIIVCFFTHGRVPVVLDIIICSTGQKFGKLCPFISLPRVQQIQNPLLILAPVTFVNAGVEMIVPALSALFSLPVRDMLGNTRPVFGTVLVD